MRTREYANTIRLTWSWVSGNRTFILRQGEWVHPDHFTVLSDTIKRLSSLDEVASAVRTSSEVHRLVLRQQISRVLMERVQAWVNDRYESQIGLKMEFAPLKIVWRSTPKVRELFVPPRRRDLMDATKRQVLQEVDDDYQRAFKKERLA